MNLLKFYMLGLLFAFNLADGKCQSPDSIATLILRQQEEIVRLRDTLAVERRKNKTLTRIHEQDSITQDEILKKFDKLLGLFAEQNKLLNSMNVANRAEIDTLKAFINSMLDESLEKDCKVLGIFDGQKRKLGMQQNDIYKASKIDGIFVELKGASKDDRKIRIEIFYVTDDKFIGDPRTIQLKKGEGHCTFNFNNKNDLKKGVYEVQVFFAETLQIFTYQFHLK